MIKKNTLLILMLLITLMGFSLRLYYFIGSNFPLYDGGFFYVMVKDLMANKFLLPEYSTYNHANIPYIYPPLGFYIVGIAESLTHIDLLQLFRYIPLIISTLTIPAFFFLALEITKDQGESLAATTVFSILPNGYAWLILGGGITRAFGALFGLLALIFVIRYISSGKWIAAVLASFFCGFTVLSHPEWAWFLFYSTGLFCILKLIAKARWVFTRALILFLGTTAIISPWLLTIILRHGNALIFPLLDNGFSRWIEIINFFLFKWSDELFLPIFTLLAIVGIFSLIKKREWFVTLWLPLVFFLQIRAAGRKAVIPLALLAGIGAKAFFDFVSRRFPERIHIRRIAMIIFIIFFYSFFGSIVYSTGLDQPIPEQFVKAIDWIQQESHIDSKFLLISGTDWTQDKYSEWISALTGRESVSVVQGYEWLPGFSNRITRFNDMQYEYSKGMGDLIAWLKQNNIRVNYLVFLKGNHVDSSNWASQPNLRINDALRYPGVDTAFENDTVLILDLKALDNH
jgi:hypothetical protein